ncbi:MAG: hypothetical protein A3A86_06375 [Elusimicrobia bacterium RIFCSPLOWO2_01_FULL_60_11]|nr:MAG: hypothetical protein A3A86_06375 [Elusimicrobia bacterium RIFCSPLOWO2_01_FULL_60_11]
MKKNIFRPYRHLILTLILVFMAELIIHPLAIFSRLPAFMGSFFDASLLSLIITPILYFFWIRPRIANAAKIAEFETTQKSSELIRKLSEVVKQTADVVFITSKDGIIEYVNPAFERVSGYLSEEVIGKSPAIIKSGKHDKKFYKTLWDTILSGRPFRAQFTNKNKGGALYIEESTITPVMDNENHITHFVATGKDITLHRRAVDQLSMNKEMYRLLFENMLEGYAHCKMIFEDNKPQDFVYLDVNVAFGELTGLKDVVGKKVTEVIPKIRESNPELFEIYGRVALTGKAEKFETYLESLSIWFSISVHSTEKGYFVAVFENITKRKRDEVTLQNNAEQMRLAIEGVHDGIWQWNVLTNEVLWSDTIYQLFRMPIGSFGNTFQLVNELVHPDDRERFAESLRVHLEENAPYNPEIRFLRGDGTYGYFLCRGTSVRDASGRPIRMVGSISDVTDRKEAEKVLLQLASIVESSNDAIIGRTLEGTVTSWNLGAEKMYGYAAREIIGKSVSILFPEDRKNEFDAITETIKKGEAIRNSETVRIKKDGAPLQVSLTISPLKDSKGGIVGASIIARDITERKHLENIVLQSEKLSAVGQLAAGLAHEINNPLGVILGFAQSCARKLQPKDDPLELPIKSIEREANRIKALVQGLLDFSRTNKSEREECIINKTIENALALIVVNAKMNSVELIREFEENLPKIVLNSSQIQQVIINLCNNAIDAMPKGGTITLRTRRVQDLGKDAIQIQVQDTGAGISKENQNKVFESFFTTKEVGKGTGLGLSISHEIVQKHGGTITLESQMGIGTTFTIRIPLT